MVYHFKFEIPKQDGNRTVAYPPNWFGTMDRCPKNVTVLILNDKEGFGIAKADDTFVPPEVDVITKAMANKELELCKAKDASIKAQYGYLSDLTMDGIPKEIWYGSKLSKRWDKVNEMIPTTPRERSV